MLISTPKIHLQFNQKWTNQTYGHYPKQFIVIELFVLKHMKTNTKLGAIGSRAEHSHIHIFTYSMKSKLIDRVCQSRTSHTHLCTIQTPINSNESVQYGSIITTWAYDVVFSTNRASVIHYINIKWLCNDSRWSVSTSFYKWECEGKQQIRKRIQHKIYINASPEVSPNISAIEYSHLFYWYLVPQWPIANTAAVFLSFNFCARIRLFLFIFVENHSHQISLDCSFVFVFLQKANSMPGVIWFFVYLSLECIWRNSKPFAFH